MSERRKNLQTKQENIQYPPEGNGWPEPLVDNGATLRFASVIGKSGSVESRPVNKIQKEG